MENEIEQFWHAISCGTYVQIMDARIMVLNLLIVTKKLKLMTFKDRNRATAKILWRLPIDP